VKGEGGRARAVPVVAFSGPSGSGKTRLLVALVRELRSRRIRVAVVKHSGHPHGFDVPGKDSDVLLRAGAEGVVVQGPAQLACFMPPRPGGARSLARLLPPADVVLVEGWKAARLPRVEVHRRSVSRAFACAAGRGFVAVVTDEPAPRPIPSFGPDEVAQLADFLCARFRIARGARRRGSST
jgi:molybdopterin-guanine dinucleotide biosynthesis protein MobB